jgi:predicted methyltransferase
MTSAVEFSHQLLRERLRPGDTAIDATAGNGRDTLFLTQLTGPDGMVFAFDVQEAAISATRHLLERNGVPPHSWRLIHAGHESMTDSIPARWHGETAAVVFNLGYLPGGDKSLTTTAATTIPAMRAALELLRPGGILVAVLYTGHPAGKDEAAAVAEFAASLPVRRFHAAEYRTLNAKTNPPFVVAVEKCGG